jgi:hypothetical protein
MKVKYCTSDLGEVFLHKEDVLETLRTDKLPPGRQKVYLNFLDHLEKMPVPPVQSGVIGLRLEANTLDIEENIVEIAFCKQEDELYVRFQDLMGVMDAHEKMSIEGAIQLEAPVDILGRIKDAFSLLRSRLKEVCDETGHKTVLESN